MIFKRCFISYLIVAITILFASYIFSLFAFRQFNVELEGLARLRFFPAGEMDVKQPSVL